MIPDLHARLRLASGATAGRIRMTRGNRVSGKLTRCIVAAAFWQETAEIATQPIVRRGRDVFLSFGSSVQLMEECLRHGAHDRITDESAGGYVLLGKFRLCRPTLNLLRN